MDTGASSNETLMEMKIFDAERLTKSISGNQESVQKIISVFLRDMPKFISALKQALDKKDIHSVKQQAHEVRSTAMIIGAFPLEESALQMQRAGEASNLDNAMSLMPKIDTQFELLKQTLIDAGLSS